MIRCRRYRKIYSKLPTAAYGNFCFEEISPFCGITEYIIVLFHSLGHGRLGTYPQKKSNNNNRNTLCCGGFACFEFISCFSSESRSFGLFKRFDVGKFISRTMSTSCFPESSLYFNEY